MYVTIGSSSTSMYSMTYIWNLTYHRNLTQHVIYSLLLDSLPMIPYSVMEHSIFLNNILVNEKCCPRLVWLGRVPSLGMWTRTGLGEMARGSIEGMIMVEVCLLNPMKYHIFSVEKYSMFHD